MHRLLRSIVVASALGILAPNPSSGDPLTRRAEGRWGLAGVNSCADNAQTMRFSEDGKTMFLSYRKPVQSVTGYEQFFEYEVLGAAGNAIRMSLSGENRKTDEGQPVVWDLVVLSADVFCWHRSDWELGRCTAPQHRCESQAALVVDVLRSATAQAIHLLSRNEFGQASQMFELPPSLDAPEASVERDRIARSLRIVVEELGAPRNPVETDQNVEMPPLFEVSLGGLGQLVSKDVSTYRFLLFTADYERLGRGFFRLQLTPTGQIAGMTFSFGPEHRERVAKIGERLLREAAP